MLKEYTEKIKKAFPINTFIGETRNLLECLIDRVAYSSYLMGIEEAEKKIPGELDPLKYYKSDKNGWFGDEEIIGWNKCRNEVLSSLQSIKKEATEGSNI